MTSKFTNQNLRYTNSLIRPSTTKGTVMTNNGNNNFELITPTEDGQILTSNYSVSAGSEWSNGAGGLGVGFGIGNGTTPNVGGTIYFLTLASGIYVPAIPIPVGNIIFFSVRPDNNSSGWSNNPGLITGGQLEYTFGHLDVAENPTTANFTPYPGGPHYTILGTTINGPGTTDFATFHVKLDIPVTVVGQQIVIELKNNLLVSGGGPTDWSEQNAFLIIRF